MAAGTKANLRNELLAARRAVPEALHRAESEKLCAHLATAVSLSSGHTAGTVCAYYPVSSEPGSPEMLDVLARLGPAVLLPVARKGSDDSHLPLQWGRYAPGRLSPGLFGLREPTEPWLPASAIATADIVLVPALAVDRRGVRLGRGGGFYDRSLPLCPPGTRLIAVVRDCEILGELPRDPHDVAMTHALTPGGGLIRLGEC
ncbi:5-formyltetrahydrofolate cyclo-ligase [Mycolicibacterium sp.]|uniref:5-formyltetrahydrofolate cyclo-ligase n=1 Tax=Mycolicibacterium sp. TaxID=2320850 RepID=UPI001D6834EC|nr:5-formyltetrahydrofolate cyclo-ligase [Mycolicibacterium sp.]MCB1292225.1 5-formyltetrahydrofolate cyclo-ligase [Mycobacterium sp.]MCB9410337.1 5-formyltetrahydrofolate cyclo-ligase [Mycolicibacterium sp.]